MNPTTATNTIIAEIIIVFVIVIITGGGDSAAVAIALLIRYVQFHHRYWWHLQIVKSTSMTSSLEWYIRVEAFSSIFVTNSKIFGITFLIHRLFIVLLIYGVGMIVCGVTGNLSLDKC